MYDARMPRGGGSPDSLTKKCSQGDGRPVRAKGLCTTHYNKVNYPDRWKKHSRSCVVCGAIWEASRIDAKYCSDGCKSTDYRRRGGPPGHIPASVMRAKPFGPRRLPIPQSVMAWRPLGPPCPPPRRVWVAGICAYRNCNASFVDVQPDARYCSPLCRKRELRRRWKEAKGRKVADSVRAYVYARDQWMCWLCGEQTVPELKAPHDLSPTVDHLIPQSQGGTHEATNLKTAHFRCNYMRGDRDSMEIITHYGGIPLIHAA